MEEGLEFGLKWNEDGSMSLPKKSNQKKGKASREAGARFELKVRADLEDKKWIVDRWSNNVDLENQKIIPAKKKWKYNPFRKIMMPSVQSTGFPDFIAFQLLNKDRYQVIGVEVKSNGILSKTEKQKCKFLLDKKIFSQILIAKKKKLGRKIEVEYIDFKEKYKKLFD